ncbi:MAG: bifunctional demethylmenaquinone methyltransferase/2-methoxy-6-polyprenyl-1,4-benzoquinol methylase UbiE [Vicinamibacterales bacterium]
MPTTPPTVRQASDLAADKRGATIAGMFDAIAARYDLLNHLLSGGLDVYWRARAVRALALTGRERLLDVCTGTGDLAIAAIRAAGRGPRRVVGVDFSGEMLRYAHGKVEQRQIGDVVNLARADALRLPVATSAVDVATVAFGIRNVESAFEACRELARALRPGGTLAILEFSLPRTVWIRRLYVRYFHSILPLLGRLISRHDEAYTYLPASVDAFPPPPAFVELLERAGFVDVQARPLTFGVVYLYLAQRAGPRVAGGESRHASAPR